jgi:hypothetical protein
MFKKGMWLYLIGGGDRGVFWGRRVLFGYMEHQVPVFISPSNRVAQLYPQALGSLFVTF